MDRLDIKPTTEKDRSEFVRLLLDSSWIDPYARLAMINRAIELGPVPYSMNQHVGNELLKVHTQNPNLIAGLSNGTYTFDKLDVSFSSLPKVNSNESDLSKLVIDGVGVFSLEVDRNYLVSAVYRPHSEYMQFITSNLINK